MRPASETTWSLLFCNLAASGKIPRHRHHRLPLRIALRAPQPRFDIQNGTKAAAGRSEAGGISVTCQRVMHSSLTKSPGPRSPMPAAYQSQTSRLMPARRGWLKILSPGIAPAKPDRWRFAHAFRRSAHPPGRRTPLAGLFKARRHRRCGSEGCGSRGMPSPYAY